MKWNIGKKGGATYFFARSEGGATEFFAKFEGGGTRFFAENLTKSSGPPPPIFNERSLTHLSRPETILWTNKYRKNREVKGHLSAIIFRLFRQCDNS